MKQPPFPLEKYRDSLLNGLCQINLTQSTKRTAQARSACLSWRKVPLFSADGFNQNPSAVKQPPFPLEKYRDSLLNGLCQINLTQSTKRTAQARSVCLSWRKVPLFSADGLNQNPSAVKQPPFPLEKHRDSLLKRKSPGEALGREKSLNIWKDYRERDVLLCVPLLVGRGDSYAQRA